jgi:hypothetical protein
MTGGDGRNDAGLTRNDAAGGVIARRRQLAVGEAIQCGGHRHCEERSDEEIQSRGVPPGLPRYARNDAAGGVIANPKGEAINDERKRCIKGKNDDEEKMCLDNFRGGDGGGLGGLRDCGRRRGWPFP